MKKHIIIIFILLSFGFVSATNLQLMRSNIQKADQEEKNAKKDNKNTIQPVNDFNNYNQ